MKWWSWETKYTCFKGVKLRVVNIVKVLGMQFNVTINMISDD